jgi:outer membrane protein assembly factor BamB
MLVRTLASMPARRWAPLVALLAAILAGCAAVPSQAARSAAAQATPQAHPSPTLYFKADGDVIALRSGDRAVLWRDANIGAGFAPPLLAGQTLYAGSDALYALDAATGARRWRTRLDSVVSGLALFQGPGGAALLIAVTGASQHSSVGSGGSAYGVRASDGAILWRVKTDENAILSPPLLSDPTVYVTTDHSAYALDARSGRILWHVTTWRFSGVAVWTAPELADGVLYVATGADDIIALRASDGASLWRYAAPGATASPMAVMGGKVFVSDAAGMVTALQARTGSVLWRRQLGQLCEGLPPPTGILYICGVRFTPDDPLFATLTAIDATTGATIWSRGFGVAGKNPLVEVPDRAALIAGTLYVGSHQYMGGFPIVPPGALSALDPQTGATLWSYPTDYGAPSLPAVGA